MRIVWACRVGAAYQIRHHTPTSYQPIGLLSLLGIGSGHWGRLAFWGRIGGYRAIGGDIAQNGLREWPQIDDRHVTRLPIPLNNRPLEWLITLDIIADIGKIVLDA